MCYKAVSKAEVQILTYSKEYVVRVEDEMALPSSELSLRVTLRSRIQELW